MPAMSKEEAKKSREGKRYQLKSSAMRAAKEDGVAQGEFALYESARGDGWYYMKKTVAVDPSDEFDKEEAAVLKKEMDEEKVAATPPVEIPPEIAVPPVQEKLVAVMTSAADLDLIRAAEQVRTVVQNALPPPALVIKPAKPSIPKVERLHKSLVAGPTKLVWQIAEKMTAENPAVTRKEVMAECVRIGIAFWTARTQYQQWITSRREADRLSAMTVEERIQKVKADRDAELQKSKKK
jgi:hypothetical protein